MIFEISPAQVDLIPDVVSIPCQGDQTSISILSPFNKGNITWSTGETTETIVVSTPGKFVVTIELNDSCHTTLRDSTLVIISHEKPSLEISGPDKICYGKTIELSAVCDSCLSYIWSTNETTNKISISKEGVFTLKAVTLCDTLYQTKKIESSNVILDSLIRFPNVFLPNGDEINRKFRPWINEMKKDSIISLNLYVYNRWGKTLYEKKDINAAWIPDADVPMETYMYVCELEYKDCDGPKKGKLKGTVTLIR
jgi:gliding motility-associated-like protein